MDISILKEIQNYLDDCHLEYPSIVKKEDLKGFEKQECIIEEFDYEMIKQGPGGGITGDIFTGELAFPIDNNRFILVPYYTK